MTSTNPYLFDMDDNSLDILNEAIQSHQSNLAYDKQDTANKRELDKEDQVEAAVTSKKSGRKPLLEKPAKDGIIDPKQKRKAQNRAAQRAYRDRKDKQMAELQARITELEEMNANKDQSLVKENNELKDLIKKLQEENNSLKKPVDENYALKNTQFTFEYPTNPIQEDVYQILNTKDEPYQLFNNTKDMSRPFYNNSTHDDGYHTLSNSSSSSTEDAGQSSPSSSNGSFSHKTPADVLDNPLLNQSFDNNLLIHGEEDLFPNFPILDDNSLFPNEDLTTLFGNDSDPFNLNMAQQFGLPDVATTKKHKWLEKLKLSKERGQYLYDFHNELKKEMPDFNIDALCDDMRRKAQCSQAKYIITDTDIENITHHINNNSFVNIF
ncbi:hypothetical protein CU098_000785 [Rhizopus stolonifer]|uniref:BZIP domain-containing protein n=1 Tax=Rhizopus stolonifer TaxID=4846 RepID=A0A367IL05_RHIST|nr:hypothetical protein CU098_000785 [Rhizopus stolonifer]